MVTQPRLRLTRFCLGISCLDVTQPRNDELRFWGPIAAAAAAAAAAASDSELFSFTHVAITLMLVLLTLWAIGDYYTLFTPNLLSSSCQLFFLELLSSAASLGFRSNNF